MNVYLFFVLLVFFTFISAQNHHFDHSPDLNSNNKMMFWKQVYAEIDSSMTVIYDKLTLHTYAVVENGSVFDTFVTIKKSVQNPKNIMLKQGRKEFVHDAILRADTFRFVVDSLIAHGLDPELRWLPVLESGYLDTMISDQNARGIWQFIPSTAKKYGLSINEITDPYKSTSAFVRYFSSLLQQFGDYPLALTAYHHGEGGIREKLKKNGAVTLEEIIPHLGFQSGNYYARYRSIVDIARTITPSNDSIKIKSKQ
jgi:hypothetical protein